MKFSTVLLGPKKLIQDQFGHAGSIGHIGEPWIDGLYGEIRVHMVFLACFWVTLELFSRPVRT